MDKRLLLIVAYFEDEIESCCSKLAFIGKGGLKLSPEEVNEIAIIEGYDETEEEKEYDRELTLTEILETQERIKTFELCLQDLKSGHYESTISYFDREVATIIRGQRLRRKLAQGDIEFVSKETGIPERVLRVFREFKPSVRVENRTEAKLTRFKWYLALLEGVK